MQKPRVLILTPTVPYPVTGACQQDRFNGYKQKLEMGYDIQVIAKIPAWQKREDAEKAFADAGIPLTLVPFAKDRVGLVRKRFGRILRSPTLIDGATLEYTDPDYERVVKETIERFKPDVVWLEYTNLWPLIRLAKQYQLPVIMKSSNNEPYQCRDESQWSLTSIIKSIPKYPGETIAATESDFILGITPVEEEWYVRHGAKHHATLPLRGLCKTFAKKKHQQKDVLDVVFLSSSYSMGHNRTALDFLLKKILPEVRGQMPGKFRFHLTGNKFPESYRPLIGEDTEVTGFVPDLGAFLSGMDIALCPWISGQGMQQKVFEPLCRSLPLITTKTGGYPFVPDTEVLIAKTPQEYVDHLRTLCDADTRQRIADAAYEKAQSVFGEEVVKKIVDDTIRSVMRQR